VHEADFLVPFRGVAIRGVCYFPVKKICDLAQARTRPPDGGLFLFGLRSSRLYGQGSISCADPSLSSYASVWIGSCPPGSSRGRIPNESLSMGDGTLAMEVAAIKQIQANVHSEKGGTHSPELKL